MLESSVTSMYSLFATKAVKPFCLNLIRAVKVAFRNNNNSFGDIMWPYSFPGGSFKCKRPHKFVLNESRNSRNVKVVI